MTFKRTDVSLRKYFARAREPSVNQKKKKKKKMALVGRRRRCAFTARRFDDFFAKEDAWELAREELALFPSTETIILFVVPKRLLLLRATTSDASRDDEAVVVANSLKHGFGPADARDGDAS